MSRKKILLTPEMAKELLEKNYQLQRRVNWSHVTTMMNDIKSGLWRPFMPDAAIIVSKNGYLLDGQQRCLAVIEADKPIGVFLEDDVDDVLFEYIDGGRTRVANDFYNGPNKHVLIALAKFAIYIDQYNATIRGASTGHITRQIRGHKTNIILSRTEVLEYIRENENELQSIVTMAQRLYHTKKNSGRFGTPTAFASAIWIVKYLENGTSFIDMFIEDYLSDVPLTAASVKLKTTLLEMRADVVGKKVKYNNTSYLSVILAAYDKFKADKPFTKKDVNNSLDIYQRKLDIRRSQKEEEQHDR